MSTDYRYHREEDEDDYYGRKEHEAYGIEQASADTINTNGDGEVNAHRDGLSAEVPEVDEYLQSAVDLGVNELDLETSSEEPLSDHLQKMALETNYPIPYRSKLVEAFEPGQTLIVKGKTAEDSVRFTINLHTASADFSPYGGNDVPLHISVRFDEGKIVFNTFSKGEWGKEERKSNPYKKGDDVDIRIRAHDSKFTIFADQFRFSLPGLMSSKKK